MINSGISYYGENVKFLGIPIDTGDFLLMQLKSKKIPGDYWEESKDGIHVDVSDVFGTYSRKCLAFIDNNITNAIFSSSKTGFGAVYSRISDVYVT